jgi:hypothetical protein
MGENGRGWGKIGEIGESVREGKKNAFSTESNHVETEAYSKGRTIFHSARSISHNIVSFKEDASPMEESTSPRVGVSRHERTERQGS